MDRFSKIDSSIDLRYKTERLAFTNKLMLDHGSLLYVWIILQGERSWVAKNFVVWITYGGKQKRTPFLPIYRSRISAILISLRM